MRQIVFDDSALRRLFLTRAIANPDYWIYALHAGFWIAFVVVRLFARTRAGEAHAKSYAAPVAATETSSRNSRLVLVPQIVAFGILYTGIDTTVSRHRIPEWLAGQRLLGGIIIVAGSALAISALLYLRSWRIRATLDAGHQLATDGPFRVLRHPIYMALDLLALGTAIWMPTPTVIAATLLMIIGSDVRARAEEKILLAAFGDAYRAYSARTPRFLPGVY